MSVEVMTWVWKHSGSRGVERLVLLAIADAASDDGGHAWPSRKTLAAKAGVDEKTVRRAILRLVELGELLVKTNRGPGGANVYRVTMRAGRPTRKSLSTQGAEHPPGGTVPGGQDDRGAQRPRGAESPQEGGAPPPPGGQAAPRTVLEPSLTVPTASRPGSDDPAAEHTDGPVRDDVERLCSHLADRIEANGSRRPAIMKRWRDAARLMIDRDGRTEQQIRRAIDWCQDDEFWRANILSMPTLREKFEQLRLQAARKGHTPAGQSATDGLFDRALQRAEQRERVAP